MVAIQNQLDKKLQSLKEINKNEISTQKYNINEETSIFQSLKHPGNKVDNSFETEKDNFNKKDKSLQILKDSVQDMQV